MILSSFIRKIFGTNNDRIIKNYRFEVEKINELELQIQEFTNSDLKKRTLELKKLVNDGISLDEIKFEAFALVREASKRVMDKRLYDVQLIGGLILHSGCIAEMRTGEGKTFVATLPAYLNALTGKSVHIITINDYLAKRDAQWVGEIFRFLGLTCSYVIGSMSDHERILAYKADIVYVTNNELGFDFLRDNMKYTMESRVLRGLNYAIIDEVDSILIDEARTPLIISGSVEHDIALYDMVDKFIRKLSEDDYEKDEKSKNVYLTESGINKMENLLLESKHIKENTSLYDLENLNLVHYIDQSLKAHFMFFKDVDYLVADKKVIIIDEFTGRLMDGRRYSDGLHQAIEAKERVPVQNENQTLASITFQNYFRMYEKLSGMTGTAMTESQEFENIYSLAVVSVPTHHPVIRNDLDDKIFGTKREKYDAIVKLVKSCNERGQPVLVGTASIEKSQEISLELNKINIQHNVLNAKFHEQEANIIAKAGCYKAVTIATNMAGRGTDIMLGGNVDMLISEIDKDAITEDEYKHKIHEIKTHIQNEKEQVLGLGGLYIIGTERHESRRIDNQLRGRSGRQGDPGSSEFFLSLEDDLMRIFAPQNISKLLRKMGLKDGENINHPMVNRSLERAQKKVESYNYEIRKNLLKFDDVMDQQRKIVYSQRDKIITNHDLNKFHDTSKEICEEIVKKFIPQGVYREEWNLSDLTKEVKRIFSITIDQEDINQIQGSELEITNYLHTLVKSLYEDKIKKYGEKVIQDICRYILITTLDQVWKEHLHSLDHLRQGISLRAYGQKDPLNEYKSESFNLFKEMLTKLKEIFVQKICHLHIDDNLLQSESTLLEKQEMPEMRTNIHDDSFKKYNSGIMIERKLKPLSRANPNERMDQDQNSWGKVARNALCPCSSGKKYKHCHGAL